MAVNGHAMRSGWWLWYSSKFNCDQVRFDSLRGPAPNHQHRLRVLKNENVDVFRWLVTCQKLDPSAKSWPLMANLKVWYELAIVLVEFDSSQGWGLHLHFWDALVLWDQCPSWGSRFQFLRKLFLFSGNWHSWTTGRSPVLDLTGLVWFYVAPSTLVLIRF
jgi:hypothetical protein